MQYIEDYHLNYMGNDAKTTTKKCVKLNSLFTFLRVYISLDPSFRLAY